MSSWGTQGSMQPQQEAVGGRVHSEESLNRSCCKLRKPHRGLHQQRHALQQAPLPPISVCHQLQEGCVEPQTLGHSILGKTDPTSPCIVNEETGAGGKPQPRLPGRSRSRGGTRTLVSLLPGQALSPPPCLQKCAFSGWNPGPSSDSRVTWICCLMEDQGTSHSVPP